MHRLLLTGVGLVLVLYLLPVFYPAETTRQSRRHPQKAPQRQRQAVRTSRFW